MLLLSRDEKYWSAAKPSRVLGGEAPGLSVVFFSGFPEYFHLDAAIVTEHYNAMTLCEAPSKQLLQGLRKLSLGYGAHSPHGIHRPFSTSIANYEEAQATVTPKPSFRRNPDPQLVSSRRLERRLVRAHNPPIGSRRRRLALQDTAGIPFEQLPYQCFQEARKILIADREEKLKQIEMERARILRLREADPALSGEARNQQRLKGMVDNLERLKILADINDPLVKRRFEDGLGKSHGG
jgi:large subunit ribosomal protein L35